MASTKQQIKLKLNNGQEIPPIALGTYLGFDGTGTVKPQNKDLRDAVLKAIDLGYRHFDTASYYDTEEELGEAIRAKISEGVVTRDEICVTTKLWNNQHKKADVAKALADSLKKLGLEYVDLYLIHWPMAINDDHTFSDVDYLETWRGVEEMYNNGLVKAIGVSNFNQSQLQRLMKESTIKPSALQIEIHPSMIQKELVEFSQANGLVVMAYSPFGSLVRRYGMELPGPKQDDPILMEIAAKYKKTSVQVVLRWLVDRNIIPVPKSVNAKRQAENIDIFDFQLTKEEIEKINSFEKKDRFTLPSFWQEHPYYPFEKIDKPIDNPFA